MSDQKFTEEKTPSDVFENAIRRFGVVAACEWFGYAADSDFTRDTKAVLDERLTRADESSEQIEES